MPSSLSNARSEREFRVQASNLGYRDAVLFLEGNIMLVCILYVGIINFSSQSGEDPMCICDLKSS